MGTRADTRVRGASREVDKVELKKYIKISNRV